MHGEITDVQMYSRILSEAELIKTTGKTLDSLNKTSMNNNDNIRTFLQFRIGKGI